VSSSDEDLKRVQETEDLTEARLLMAKWNTSVETLKGKLENEYQAQLSPVDILELRLKILIDMIASIDDPVNAIHRIRLETVFNINLAGFYRTVLQKAAEMKNAQQGKTPSGLVVPQTRVDPSVLRKLQNGGR
jgi:hypothetical protein